MKRSIILKNDPDKILLRLHDWFYRKIIEDIQGGFEVHDLTDVFNFESKGFSISGWLAEFPKESLNITDQEYSIHREMTDQSFIYRMNKYLVENTSIKGRFSGLLIDDKRMTLIVLAQYEVEFSPHDIENFNRKYPVLSVVCYDAGGHKTELISYCFPNVAWLLDTLWEEIPKMFEVALLQPVQDTEPRKPEKPQIPKRGSKISVWFDYYHSMKNAGYKISFTELEKISNYSANTFKQEHGRYKAEREID